MMNASGMDFAGTELAGDAELPMLLYAVAALRVEPDGVDGWFRRCRGALPAVISREEDVSDILLRLPDCWNIVDAARCVGLHDEIDILTGDPRFNRGIDAANCAIVGHADGTRFALLLQINAAEAVLIPERPFTDRGTFEGCLWLDGQAES
ncbi:hypothetical protein DSC91_001960 [Paraburkholderia caffeinilytica]|uniref:PIN domain-containing protein n=1 Tax=Paraburkholderia caffeinilytica TaxID=1761016 RepID=A0ABQ1ME39_9BURK|nr:hypothetical protein [Paraburkholderia caffeinilytica]AXL49956.1 hypothetical protein DSC91_001960 [Paraburkholderia caffeinilytica]GGC39183.1 hypothetical protein GCM10011400_27360 [Paraburkholderia caffeinilytica]CAB3786478.1 hypothetical protein LMG28690_02240 [Paraburkholderia caffeinilytica]